VNKEHVLGEIRRTAEVNGGVPLGKARFEAETGIRENDWSGRFWARWSDALVEAGLPPNELQGRLDEDLVLSKLVDEIRRLGRMPTHRELQLRRRADSSFPSAKVFDRFGPKALWAEKVAEYCADRPECEDVLAIVMPLIVEADDEPPEETTDDTSQHGFVYLLKSGRHYKIGLTFDVERRKRDLAIQLPEAATQEHVIATDDPAGIERYWHTRFATRRKNGEWFELTRADVAAFKRRKFM